MPFRITILAVALTLMAVLSFEGFAQDPGVPASDPGLAAKAGRTLDQIGKGIKSDVKQMGQKIGNVGQDIKIEATQVSMAVSKKFDTVKTEVQRMPLHHRVYSRIHWDKELMDSKVEVHMLREGVVLLQGTVPNPTAKDHALALARGTAEVTDVIDELRVAEKSTSPKSTTAAAPKTVR